MTNDFLEIIRGFANLRLVVAGDLMLDHYILGTTERTSPEAPVPVVLVGSEKFVAGGAANVACNLQAAGAQVNCAGLVGTGHNGTKLLQMLNNQGIRTDAVMQAAQCSTIIKTRVVSQGQQIVRLDYEKRLRDDQLPVADMQRQIVDSSGDTDAIILSDYGKGFLGEAVISAVLAKAKAAGCKVFVDPKGRDYARYRGCYAITPNSREAQEATGISTFTEDGLSRAADEIHRVTGCPLVVITRGADGLALRDSNGEMAFIPTTAREVFDVTGAGDTFIAWLALGVTAGMDPASAARLANVAAGIAVGRVGPAVVSPLDIRQALMPGRLGKKIVPEPSLAELGEQLRAGGKRIVLANGCFDFLHAGHVAFLQQARSQGDVLIVATNTDESVRRLKGEGRPVIGRQQREELLASIESVDYVTVFEGDTPRVMLEALRPDVLVKGSNFTEQQVEGGDIVAGYGGEVRILPIQHDFHTDQLIR